VEAIERNTEYGRMLLDMLEKAEEAGNRDPDQRGSPAVSEVLEK